MGLSSCKAAINIQGLVIIEGTKTRMKGFHKKFTDTRGFKKLSREQREEFYNRQIAIETSMVADLERCCDEMDALNHDMGVAIDAEAD